jgi:hypothetical protein
MGRRGQRGSKTAGDNRRPEYDTKKDDTFYGYSGDADARRFRETLE